MEQDNTHFNKLFWFCVGLAALGLLFLICLCYIPVPKDNQHYAENCLGFIQGAIITAAVAFLLGGNMPSNRKTTVPVTGDNPSVTVQTDNVDTK